MIPFAKISFNHEVPDASYNTMGSSELVPKIITSERKEKKKKRK